MHSRVVPLRTRRRWEVEWGSRLQGLRCVCPCSVKRLFKGQCLSPLSDGPLLAVAKDTAGPVHTSLVLNAAWWYFCLCQKFGAHVWLSRVWSDPFPFPHFESVLPELRRPGSKTLLTRSYQ